MVAHSDVSTSTKITVTINLRHHNTDSTPPTNILLTSSSGGGGGGGRVDLSILRSAAFWIFAVDLAFFPMVVVCLDHLWILGSITSSEIHSNMRTWGTVWGSSLSRQKREAASAMTCRHACFKQTMKGTPHDTTVLGRHTEIWFDTGCMYSTNTLLTALCVRANALSTGR